MVGTQGLSGNNPSQESLYFSHCTVGSFPCVFFPGGAHVAGDARAWADAQHLGKTSAGSRWPSCIPLHHAEVPGLGTLLRVFFFLIKKEYHSFTEIQLTHSVGYHVDLLFYRLQNDDLFSTVCVTFIGVPPKGLESCVAGVPESICKAVLLEYKLQGRSLC